MGNPHAVFFDRRSATRYDLARIGPMLENHPVFPERANISVAQVTGRDDQAPGLGARRRADARLRHRRLRRRGGGLAAADDRPGATVSLPGGDLVIEWRADDHVLMTGPVFLEGEGSFAPELFMVSSA